MHVDLYSFSFSGGGGDGGYGSGAGSSCTTDECRRNGDVILESVIGGGLGLSMLVRGCTFFTVVTVVTILV